MARPIADDLEYGRAALTRRKLIHIGGSAVCVASPEDVPVVKMQWAKRGGPDRQLQDSAGILSTQGSKLEIPYIERRVRELRLKSQWQAIREIFS